MSSTGPVKVCYLRSNISLWSQCTCTCLRISVLARRRRAQSWQEFLETAQQKKSTDDCLLLTVFCHLHLLTRTTCFFQRDWGAAARKFSANISFGCLTGFQSTKEPFVPICSQFLSLWDWKIFRFGEKKIQLVGRSYYPVGVHTIERALSHSGDSGDSVIFFLPQLHSWVPTSWLGPKEVKNKLYQTSQWKTQWWSQVFWFQFFSRSLMS